jgi:peptidoglycan/LPS O-acetylase OafA/YrhL
VQGEGTGGPVPESAYRADIQGLRAVAVLLVVLNHTGLSFVRGGYVGVDVFFVVSGFLITGLLLRGSASGHIDLLDFYSRRARRILPAAALTLVATDVAAWVLLNYVRAQAAIVDSIWAAFFAANIEFERIGTNYFASGLPPSPIQHFWSLAVEEQFYLVWPFLLALLLFSQQWFASSQKGEEELDERPTQAGRGVLIALLVLVALSLAWCVQLTQMNPTDAYFSPFARAWELGLGAALAVAAPLTSVVPRVLKAAVSWIGLVGILAGSVWFTENTPFPGAAALLPVLSTGLVIVGGIGPGTRFGAGALLGLAPLRFVGGVSYSFYLWHWPFLVIGSAYTAGRLGLSGKLGLVAAAFGTAVVTYFLFENPLRRSRRLWGRRPSRSGGLALWPASLIVVLVVSAFGLNALRQVQARQEALVAPLSSPTPPASRLTIPEQVAASVESAARNEPLPRMFPSIDSLSTDYFDLPGCIVPSGPITQGKICYEGDLKASRSMVVFGDSHAAVWMPALIPIATTEKWKLIPVIKDACVPGTWGTGPCSQWYGWALGQVRQQAPSVVIVGDCRYSCQLPGWGSDMRAAIRSFRALGARVIVLGDSPGEDMNSVDCLLAPGATMRSCTFPLPTWKVNLNADSAETVRSEGAGYLDVQAWFCAQEMCPDVVGVVIVYRDTNHLTRTYVDELTQPLSAMLALNG